MCTGHSAKCDGNFVMKDINEYAIYILFLGLRLKTEVFIQFSKMIKLFSDDYILRGSSPLENKISIWPLVIHRKKSTVV